MNAMEIIACIYRGEIPGGLKPKTEYIFEVLKLEHSISSVQALLITAARRDDFKDDRKWAAWCEEKFNFNGSYRCHMVQAGRLLLDTMKNIELFQMLYRLEIYKLISLERIDRLRLPEFIQANDVEKLTRDQVRDAVNAWLGCEEPSKSFPVNPAAAKAHQPDLFDLIGNACALGPESVIKAINNEQKAAQACDSGLIMFGCSLEYFKANPGAMSEDRIKAIEEALEDELQTLRAMKATAAGFKIAK